MAVFTTGRAGGSFGEWKVVVSSGLTLVAAPTFLLMGGASAITAPDIAMCTSAISWSPISDMALMYLLMGVFHLSPWLKLLAAHARRQTEGD